MRSHSRQNDASVWFPGWRSVRKQALHDTRRTILSRGSILFGLVLGLFLQFTSLWLSSKDNGPSSKHW